ncbi:MAG: HEPN domain-containing protein [Deltaproteobacteria bacterium]|nr:HEPN domain-containing protein [Deltaproteobacteria bacterium]
MNPGNEKSAPGSPAQWIAHAESDLRMARLGAEDSAVLREQVCFHAQQAAEKALKAILLSRKIEFPYTHDIKGLIRIAETNGVVIPPAIQQAVVLTPYAVETRYPGGWMDITESDVQEALEKAEQTILWAKNRLASEGDKS